MLLKTPYNSPRWSGEIYDCSLPLTFDTYSSCSYNCLYCFAFFQKSRKNNNYNKDSKLRDVQSVNIDKVKRLFNNSLNGKPKTDYEKQFAPYIKDKITLQWGGLADAFDENEKLYGKSLELLEFFDEIDYPLSISTKATWFTKDKRYMNLISKHSHNWHFKFSIISNDTNKCKIIEEYCPSPNERFKAMKRISDTGVSTTLRLRPYIIGLSDDYEELINKASECGAKSVSTEFFCLENKASNELLNKYKQISELIGYDIHDFYKKHSIWNGKKIRGYKKLNYKIKKPIIDDMKNVCHKNGLYFYVSDCHHKEKCDSVCCCGVPHNFKVYTGHIAQALLIAKKNGIVKWSDICSETYKYTGHFSFVSAYGIQNQTTRNKSLRLRQSLYDYLRECWNVPKNNKSPYSYFNGKLYPIGLDDNNDVIYKYRVD